MGFGWGKNVENALEQTGPRSSARGAAGCGLLRCGSVLGRRGGLIVRGFLLRVVLGTTDKCAPAGFAPIAIGSAVTLTHLITIPMTNTSVNPVRSTGVAVFVGDWAVGQLRLFWLAPIVGALLGAMAYRCIASDSAPKAL